MQNETKQKNQQKQNKTSRAGAYGMSIHNVLNRGGKRTDYVKTVTEKSDEDFFLLKTKGKIKQKIHNEKQINRKATFFGQFSFNLVDFPLLLLLCLNEKKKQVKNAAKSTNEKQVFF